MSGEYEDKPQPLIEHLIELRRRLMWAVGAFFARLPRVLLLCQGPVQLSWSCRSSGRSSGPACRTRNVELIYTAPQEFFFTQMKVAMFGALVIAFPIIAAADLQVRRARPLQERAGGVPAVPDRLADPVPDRRSPGHFFFTPMVMWFFLSMEQGGGEGEVSISAPAEGLRISQPDHDADLLLRPGVPASGDLLAFGRVPASSPRRRSVDKRKYAIVIALYRRGGADAARSDLPDPVLHCRPSFSTRFPSTRPTRGAAAGEAPLRGEPDSETRMRRRRRHRRKPTRPEAVAASGRTLSGGKAKPFSTPGTTMLDIKWIRENPEALDAASPKRGAEPAVGQPDRARRKAPFRHPERAGHAVAPQRRLQGDRRGHGAEEHASLPTS